MENTIREILLTHYRQRPDQLYVRCVFPNGEDAHLTYRSLLDRGAYFAHRYRDLGARKGDIVVVILPHSVDLYCAFFGAMLGGQIPAMLSVPSFKLSADYYRQELEALLKRIGARAVVMDSEIAGSLALESPVIGNAAVVLADQLEFEVVPIPELEVSPKETVLLQHSSGSTGLKKGVALSNKAVIDHVRIYASLLKLQEGDRIASWLPLYHDMGLIASAIMPAIMGIPVTAISPFHWITSPTSLLQAITQDCCTLTWMPNFAYEFLATRVRPSQLQGIRLESMRGWINCSEPTIAESHRRFLQRYEPLGVRAETLWTCYAAAETTFAISQSTDAFLPRIERVKRETFLTRQQAILASDKEEASLEMLSGGALIPNTEVRIVDEARNVLPERMVGEIAIRSGSLFSGYFGDAETASAVLHDGWYSSGDLGYLADGHLFVTGRKKDLIIIAGKNYYPQDIERIVSSVPGIYAGRVVALGMDDPKRGTQRLIVLAEVVDPELVESAELSATVRSILSERMDCVIDDLRLVPHMWLLKTSSGKIARHPNLQRYLENLYEKDVTIY